MEITVLQAIGKIYTSRYRVEKLSQTVDGLWRSLVAHLTGGQGVVGSNPASPTMRTPVHGCGPVFCFLGKYRGNRETE